MINGVHILLYSADPTADQAALNKVLNIRSVAAGEDRLIMGLPPAEVATHAASGTFVQRHADHDLQGAVLYLMCDHLPSTVEKLSAQGIGCTEVEDTEFGLKTTIVLPSGAQLGLYQPSHETALD